MEAAASTSISFTKQLLKSHVSDRFKLALPKVFCETHLPCHDDTIVLVENQSKREFYVGYYAKENRVVRDWKYFVRENGLLEGDTLVFKLIEPCKFKVYIKRAGTGECHQATRAVTSCQDNEKEWEDVDHAGADKASILPQVAGWKTRKMNSMVKLQCGNILRELMSRSSSWTFNEPVDPVKLNFPDYISVIKDPMDLETIKYKLDGNRYSNLEEFAADVRLILSNATLYNDYSSIKLDLLASKLKRQRLATAGDDGQDSRQSVKKSCDDKKTECTFGVHPGAGKVHPVKIVKYRSKFAVNNVHVKTAKCPLCGGLVCCCRENDTPDQTCSSDLSAEHDSCSDSEKVKLCQIRKRVHEEMILEKKENHVKLCIRKEQCVTEQSSQCGIENSKAALSFQDINGFKDFKIYVNGEMLDSELPTDIRLKYYQLCCVQKKLLHEHLIAGVNIKSVVEMIPEITSIADAMVGINISAPVHDLDRMDRTLQSFEDKGMAVGYLRADIPKLIKLSREYQTVEESSRDKPEEIERERKVFMDRKARIDELIDRAMAHGKFIGQLEANLDAQKKKMADLSAMFKVVTGRMKWNSGTRHSRNKRSPYWADDYL